MPKDQNKELSPNEGRTGNLPGVPADSEIVFQQMLQRFQYNVNPPNGKKEASAINLIKMIQEKYHL